MKIGILYICTGKYDIFWKDFYLSCEKYFFTEEEKVYYVFTDAPQIYNESSPKIVKIFQENLGWPHNTLMRFSMFQTVTERLRKETDYLFFFNANALLLDRVGSEILPTGDEQYLVVASHPLFYKKPVQQFPYERNSESLACISAQEGKYYLGGGFNGGRTSEYLELIKTLSDNIETDLSKGIIAAWHDESHLNRYFIDHPPKVLTPAYLFPGDHPYLPYKKIILMRDKKLFGGHDHLRNDHKDTSGKGMACFRHRVKLLLKTLFYRLKYGFHIQ